jgi:hypothetical protein
MHILYFETLTATSTVVTVRVGPPDKAVNIPFFRELLSSVSPYFRAAFEDGFQEAIDGVTNLPGVTEETFRIFFQWVHVQLRPAGSAVTIPDLMIFKRTIPQKLEGGLRVRTGSELLDRQLPNKAFDEEGYKVSSFTDRRRAGEVILRG